MSKQLYFIISIVIATIVIFGVALWTGLDSFLFAWVLNLMLMMCLQGFTKAIQPKLTSNYYHLKKWEQEGKIYKYFGVNIFKKLMVLIGWEKIHKKDNPVKNSVEALENLEYSNRQSEFAHLIVFLIIMVFTIFIAIQFGIVNSLWLLILNIILNLYPVMVQRYNRPKFKRLLAIKLKYKSRFLNLTDPKRP